jgi:hypothetical protein
MHFKWPSKLILDETRPMPLYCESVRAGKTVRCPDLLRQNRKPMKSTRFAPGSRIPGRPSMS